MHLKFPLENAHDFYVKCLNLYDEIIADESNNIWISYNRKWRNNACKYATNSYCGRSYVSVRVDSDELFDYASDQGICYGQVL